MNTTWRTAVNNHGRIRLAALLVLTLGLSSCSMAGAVKSRAAYDLNCSEDRIEVRNIGGNSYAATGCGKDQTYTCTRAVNSPPSCAPDAPRR